MKTTTILLAAAAMLTASVSFAAGERHATTERLPPEGAVVISGPPAQMTVFDYFFNNPEKYRTMRNNTGEYYEGLTRR